MLQRGRKQNAGKQILACRLKERVLHSPVGSGGGGEVVRELEGLHVIFDGGQRVPPPSGLFGCDALWFEVGCCEDFGKRN